MAAVRRLQIFGARCSGTNWVDALMRENYLGVEVLRSEIDGGSDNFGWKHGDFGAVHRNYVDEDTIRHDGHGHIVREEKGVIVAENDRRYVGVDGQGDVFLKNNVLPVDWASSSDALLVVVSRNPIRWLRALHRKPHHALKLYDLPFSDFMKLPWVTYASPPIGTLNDAEKRAPWINKGIVLEDNASVFEHRQVSLATFHSFREKVQNVVYVSYESVLQDPESVITEIANQYGIQTRAAFANVASYKGLGGFEYAGTNYAQVDADALAYVLAHIDWETEYEAGYSLRAYGEPFTSEQLANPSSLVQINHQTRYYRDGERVASAVAESFSPPLAKVD
jgi:hypothetical protein